MTRLLQEHIPVVWWEEDHLHKKLIVSYIEFKAIVKTNKFEWF